MEFPRPQKRHSGLELTPLIDVVFLLIVFLILTANFQMPSLSMALPSGKSEDPAAEKVVLVELAYDGTVAVDGESVPREEFDQTIRSLLDARKQRAVRLLADQRVEYGKLLPMIEAVRNAGATAVDLVHDTR